MRKWLVEFQHGIGPTDPVVERFINVTFTVRRLITSYTILCNGYIVYKVAKNLPVPEIGSELFPWV
jgi:hypothetical protein